MSVELEGREAPLRRQQNRLLARFNFFVGLVFVDYLLFMVDEEFLFVNRVLCVLSCVQHPGMG